MFIIWGKSELKVVQLRLAFCFCFIQLNQQLLSDPWFQSWRWQIG